jgi:hypothetical protein
MPLQVTKMGETGIGTTTEHPRPNGKRVTNRVISYGTCCSASADDRNDAHAVCVYGTGTGTGR